MKKRIVSLVLISSLLCGCSMPTMKEIEEYTGISLGSSESTESSSEQSPTVQNPVEEQTLEVQETQEDVIQEQTDNNESVEEHEESTEPTEPTEPVIEQSDTVEESKEQEQNPQDIKIEEKEETEESSEEPQEDKSSSNGLRWSSYDEKYDVAKVNTGNKNINLMQTYRNIEIVGGNDAEYYINLTYDIDPKDVGTYTFKITDHNLESPSAGRYEAKDDDDNLLFYTKITKNILTIYTFTTQVRLNGVTLIDNDDQNVIYSQFMNQLGNPTSYTAFKDKESGNIFMTEASWVEDYRNIGDNSCSLAYTREGSENFRLVLNLPISNQYYSSELLYGNYDKYLSKVDLTTGSSNKDYIKHSGNLLSEYPFTSAIQHSGNGPTEVVNKMISSKEEFDNLLQTYPDLNKDDLENIFGNIDESFFAYYKILDTMIPSNGGKSYLITDVFVDTNTTPFVDIKQSEDSESQASTWHMFAKVDKKQIFANSYQSNIFK